MIKPLGNFVLIEASKIENVSEGGIILQDDMVSKEQAVEQTGTIIAFGPTAYKRWKGCESPRWLEKAITRAGSPIYGSEQFEAICDYWKWEDPDYPPHRQWGIEVGDTVEHRKFNAMNSVLFDDKVYRYIQDIEILGVKDET